MDKKGILKILSETLEADFSELEALLETTSLVELGFDSLRFIEFIVAFEEKYGVEVYDSDLLLENFATVNLMCQTLEKYFAGGEKRYKCVVTDCDGVLWKGIAGESGEDEAYTDGDTNEYQKTLKTLAEKGVYICLCSKNSMENIGAMFDGGMPLDLSDVVITKQNSTDKAEAINEIAAELGISADSIILIDDSDYELGLVSALIPDVTAVKADYTGGGFISYLSALFENVPEQPLDRTKLYREQKEREKVHYKPPYQNDADDHAAQNKVESDDTHRFGYVVPMWHKPYEHTRYSNGNTAAQPHIKIIRFAILGKS